MIVANPEKLASDAGYRSEVRRFVRALGAATAWARSHPQQAVATMQTHSSRDYLGQINASVPATLKLLRTSRLDPSAWTAFGLWMWKHGLLDQKPDGAALVASP